MSVDLHAVLKNSYNPDPNAFQGYNYDKDLSNHNQQVYFHPEEKKLLFSVAGTHNASDVGTDAMLMAGKLKDSQRYKEAQNTLALAKAKYQPDNTTLAGHSLGATVVSYLGGKNDKVFTLDKGATIGQKSRKNETAFRSAGDAVSILNANSKNMTTIPNKNSIFNRPSVSGFFSGGLKNITRLPSKIVGSTFLNRPSATGFFAGGLKKTLDAHNVDNIKGKNIII